MSDRSNIIVGLLALTATLVVIPASAALLRSSVDGRREVAILRTPTTFEIRGTDILDPAMYDTQVSVPEELGATLRLVSVVTAPAEAEAALGAWNSVKGESLIKRADMRVRLTTIGEAFALTRVPTEVAVNRVKGPVEFSTRTGIRVFPFTLVIASGDHVLAAGAGLPDESFIRDAAERFVRDGRNATTTFRRVTREINSGLKSLELLVSSDAAAPTQGATPSR